MRANRLTRDGVKSAPSVRISNAYLINPKTREGVGLVEVGGFVIWVFWWWFVGCLVVEGVGLALGGGVSELEAMTDSG
jgi:hypothetical protein